jgi:hypothetical protein
LAAKAFHCREEAIRLGEPCRLRLQADLVFDSATLSLQGHLLRALLVVEVPFAL